MAMVATKPLFSVWRPRSRKKRSTKQPSPPVVELKVGSAAGDSSLMKTISERVDLRAAIALIKRGRWVTKLSMTWFGTVVRH